MPQLLQQWTMPQMLHETGQAVEDAFAIGGSAWEAYPGRDVPEKLLYYGPYATTVGVGANKAVFRLKQRGAKPDDLVATIEIANPQGIDRPVSRRLFGRDFSAGAGNGFQSFPLDFEHLGRGGVVFQTRWAGKCAVSADAVQLAYEQKPTPVPPPPAGDFQLLDGDRVVFYGDSITESGIYPRFVEEFQRCAYPARRVSFLNAGVAGDTSAGGLARLEADVLSLRPTVVLLNFGMNDSGYADWQTNLDARLQGYRDNNAEMIRKLQYFGVRVYFMTPFTVDYTVRPDLGAVDMNECLRLFANIQAELCAEFKLAALPAPWGGACETTRALELPRDPDFYLAADGIHPGARGHMAAAGVLLHMWTAKPLSTVLPVSAPADLGGSKGFRRKFDAVPCCWTPTGIGENWLGSEWMWIELALEGPNWGNGPWRASVNEGDGFILLANGPRRNIAALAVANARFWTARSLDEAVYAKDQARFDTWRRKPDIPPLDPINIEHYDEYRHSLDATLAKRGAALNASAVTMSFEASFLPVSIPKKPKLDPNQPLPPA